MILKTYVNHSIGNQISATYLRSGLKIRENWKDSKIGKEYYCEIQLWGCL